MRTADHRNRQSFRLRGYDYSRNGAYYITICTFARDCLFGKIENDTMIFNELGAALLEQTPIKGRRSSLNLPRVTRVASSIDRRVVRQVNRKNPSGGISSTVQSSSRSDALGAPASCRLGGRQSPGLRSRSDALGAPASCRLGGRRPPPHPFGMDSGDERGLSPAEPARCRRSQRVPAGRKQGGLASPRPARCRRSQRVAARRRGGAEDMETGFCFLGGSARESVLTTREARPGAGSASNQGSMGLG